MLTQPFRNAFNGFLYLLILPSKGVALDQCRQGVKVVAVNCQRLVSLGTPPSNLNLWQAEGPYRLPPSQNY